MYSVTYLEMFFGIATYHLFNYYLRNEKMNISEHWAFQKGILVHNAALCVYSGWSFIETAKILSQYSIAYLFSDNVAVLLTSDRYKQLLYYFYLSKYWEFIDTWIHFIKGREPSFLQVFHHTGAVLMIGTGIYHEVACVWLFVTFNSFVHTLMYGYYALSCMKIKVPYKHLLTTVQIAQLVSANTLGWYYFFFTNMPMKDRILLSLSTGYILGLVNMFVLFYNRAYGNRIKSE